MTYSWNDLEEQTLNPLLTRRVFHTRNLTIARLRLRQGAVVPMHHHANEQVTMLESGALRFVVSGEERILRAGEMLEILPDAPHMVEALEDSVVTDLFSPPREDWIRGDDAYLREPSVR
jgi:quercetin dioxygenase-like cupin family protein